MGYKIRPKIDSDLVLKIKSKHPSETALMDMTETIVWALKQFLAFEEIVKEGAV